MTTAIVTQEEIDIGGGVKLRFSRIPAGSFRMGSRNGAMNEQPVHRVELTEFCMGVTPVTQKEWRVLIQTMAGQLSQLDNDPIRFNFKGGNCPVEGVSWFDCMKWCDGLTAYLRMGGYAGFGAGMIATLPTEAQWEYACRGAREEDWATTDYFNGDGDAALDQVGWYGQDFETGSTSSVDSDREPNAWGLRDVHGNVWEWCWDDWDEDAYRKRVDGVVDPCNPSRAVRWQERGNANRVVRGGCWGNSAWLCRAACRAGGGPVSRFGSQSGSQGFRVCLLAPGPQASQSAGEVGSESSPSQARRQAEAGNGDDGEIDLSRTRANTTPRSGKKI
jgi:formylglycine-generating enzyme required for sulfatase activity